MAKKEIDLLNAQIEKLNDKNFDLEAWKKYTIIVLARIFGENTQKIKQVESITYDYSSWSLRDTSGSSSYLDTCKKLGKRILEASIEELKIFGLPEKDASSNILFEALLTALKDELKGSQYKELKTILTSNKPLDEIKQQVLERLNSYGSEVSVEILASLLSSITVINKFNDK